MWYTYILRSKKDGKRYIGSTNNIKRRLKEHNLGQVMSTKNRVPFELIYYEVLNSESEARSKEQFLKTHRGYNELKRLKVI